MKTTKKMVENVSRLFSDIESFCLGCTNGAVSKLKFAFWSENSPKPLTMEITSNEKSFVLYIYPSTVKGLARMNAGYSLNYYFVDKRSGEIFAEGKIYKAQVLTLITRIFS
jgi:hypothetical protein